MNYLNEDGFGYRIADNIINGSYYDGVEEQEQDTKRLTKAEEKAITNRIIELMTGKKKNAKV